MYTTACKWTLGVTGCLIPALVSREQARGTKSDRSIKTFAARSSPDDYQIPPLT